MEEIKNGASSLSSEERNEIKNLTDTLADVETELVPVDVDEISRLMQVSDDDIQVPYRVTEFHDLNEVLTKKESGPKFTQSLAKYKQKRKNKQKQVKSSRKKNR
jgi:hypothetical protein